MRRWIYILVFLLICYSSLGIKVKDASHSTSYTSYIAVVSPLDSLTLSETNNTFYSGDYSLKTFIPLSSLNIEIANNTAYSSGFSVNVTEFDGLRLLKNTSSLYTEFISKLNATVIVGKNPLDDYLLQNYYVGMEDGFVRRYDKIGVYPFDAVVLSANVSGARMIFVYGNAVEGEVAGLRYLKNHLDEFRYMDNSVFLEDIDGLSVYDYMHLSENQKWYNTDSNEFKEIVNKSLYGKVNESIIDVKTNDGILLRVLEVKPLNSDKINEYRNNDSTPIVFAGGLWSNIDAWKNFGNKLADDGRKVYLIEITGGPGQDCDTCANYAYDDLVDSYWPAMIGTIQSLENDSSLIYIGHSNGARTGISSLERYNGEGKNNAGQYFNGLEWKDVSMTPSPVKTFFAVGMPGAFDGEQNALGNQIIEKYNITLENLDNKNNSHITYWNAFEAYLNVKLSIDSNDKISLNLLKEYFSWIKESNDTQPIINTIPKAIIITGTEFDAGDGIVTRTDQNILFNDSQADITHQYYVFTLHTGMSENKQIQNIIKYELVNLNTTLIQRMWGGAYREK